MRNSTDPTGYEVLDPAPLRPPHILCVVGEIGSGKTTIAGLLERHYGYAALNLGAVLRALLAIPESTPRSAMQDASDRFLSCQDGRRKLALGVAREWRRVSTDRFIADGIRHRATFDELREVTQTTVAVIFVDCDPAVAYARCRRLDPTITVDSFAQYRAHAVERDIPRFREIASVILFNSTDDVRQTTARLREIMRSSGVQRAR